MNDQEMRLSCVSEAKDILTAGYSSAAYSAVSSEDKVRKLLSVEEVMTEAKKIYAWIKEG